MFWCGLLAGVMVDAAGASVISSRLGMYVWLEKKGGGETLVVCVCDVKYDT